MSVSVEYFVAARSPPHAGHSTAWPRADVAVAAMMRTNESRIEPRGGRDSKQSCGAERTRGRYCPSSARQVCEEAYGDSGQIVTSRSTVRVIRPRIART